MWITLTKQEKSKSSVMPTNFRKVRVQFAKNAIQVKSQTQDLQAAKTVQWASDTPQVTSANLVLQVDTALILDFALLARVVSSAMMIKVPVDRVGEVTNVRKENIKQQKLNARKILTQKRDQVNARIVLEGKNQHREL